MWCIIVNKNLKNLSKICNYPINAGTAQHDSTKLNRRYKIIEKDPLCEIYPQYEFICSVKTSMFC